MRGQKLFLLLLSLMLLSGCVQKEVVDDVNIAVGIGLDKKDDQILGSVMIPVYKTDRSIENFTFTSKGTVTRDIIFQMSHKSSQPIVTGSLEVGLFGEEVAREGIIEFLDAFQRDPSVGARVYLAVVDGTASEIFKGNYGDRGNAIYLSGLIQQNTERGNMPLTNVHQFLFDFYQKGKDPFLPLLKKTQPDLVNIAGVALFKDEKVIDSIPTSKMFYFKLLVDEYSEGTIKIKADNKESVIKSLKSKYKFRLKKRSPYEFDIHINIDALVSEYTGRTVSKKVVKKIEKQLERQVASECTKLIKKFQEKHIDPIGLGHFAKTQTRGFDFTKWTEEYPNAEVNVSVDVSIAEVGVVE
ncbi:Ger(x)C family spore germination protein [Mesobacillus foraminis]|uniref:Ger(x)C family spore germination protein n=1 Tax=Mesobacillus foraminis TaxID=279826 RepID=UPI00214CE7D6|nr:Ger(x)C family spore germination protein [Mesobacillus foraminis]